MAQVGNQHCSKSSPFFLLPQGKKNASRLVLELRSEGKKANSTQMDARLPEVSSEGLKYKKYGEK